jgi:hypothetical protein
MESKAKRDLKGVKKSFKDDEDKDEEMVHATNDGK